MYQNYLNKNKNYLKQLKNNKLKPNIKKKKQKNK